MPLGTSSTNNLRFYGGTANREIMDIYRVSDTNGLVIASITTSASNNKTYPLLNLIPTDNPNSFVGGISATSAEAIRGFSPYKSGFPHTYTLATSADVFCINLSGSSPTPTSGCIYLVLILHQDPGQMPASTQPIPLNTSVSAIPPTNDRSSISVRKTEAPKTRDGETKRYFHGFEYTRANATSVKITYHCSSYRKPKLCPGMLVFNAASMTYDFDNMVPHTCQNGAAVGHCYR
ncbi:Hypothetical protein PHPALM_11749 [Phytophthora palmivora]|uniref:Uncharacterized protein n=1 Tax=Phytophthora palmivora TaxID=4796 RepID=A0A2P4Y1G4_9STRA|nr:Hypothetical protein PHPALM_11749 [Phytophthora palmivora]